jgi:hypothetical protein
VGRGEDLVGDLGAPVLVLIASDQDTLAALQGGLGLSR